MGSIKEASEQKAGLLDNQASAIKEGSTSEGGIIDLDKIESSAKVLFRGKEMTAKEAKDRINRGYGYEEAISVADKAKATIAQMTKEQQALLELINQRDSADKQKQTEGKIRGYVDTAVKAATRQVSGDDYDPDLDLNPETQPQFDADGLLASVKEYIDGYVAQIPQLAEKRIKEVYETEFSTKKQQEEDNAFLKSQEQLITDSMNVEFADFVEVSPKEANKMIQRVIDLQGRNLEIDLKYPSLWKQRDPQWRELLQEKLENDQERIKILSAMEQQQKRAETQRQVDAVLSQGINPAQFKPEAPPSKPKNKKEAEAWKAETERQKKAIADAIKKKGRPPLAIEVNLNGFNNDSE